MSLEFLVPLFQIYYLFISQVFFFTYVTGTRVDSSNKLGFNKRLRKVYSTDFYWELPNELNYYSWTFTELMTTQRRGLGRDLAKKKFFVIIFFSRRVHL